MAQNVVEKTTEYITESAHQAVRATGMMADAIDDGAKAVRRVARQSSDAAEEVHQRFNQVCAHRNLWPTMAATLMVGVISGVMIGWMTKRR